MLNLLSILIFSFSQIGFNYLTDLQFNKSNNINTSNSNFKSNLNAESVIDITKLKFLNIPTIYNWKKIDAKNDDQILKHIINNLIVQSLNDKNLSSLFTNLLNHPEQFKIKAKGLAVPNINQKTTCYLSVSAIEGNINFIGRTMFVINLSNSEQIDITIFQKYIDYNLDSKLDLTTVFDKYNQNNIFLYLDQKLNLIEKALFNEQNLFSNLRDKNLIFFEQSNLYSESKFLVDAGITISVSDPKNFYLGKFFIHHVLDWKNNMKGITLTEFNNLNNVVLECKPHQYPIGEIEIKEGLAKLDNLITIGNFYTGGLQNIFTKYYNDFQISYKNFSSGWWYDQYKVVIKFKGNHDDLNPFFYDNSQLTIFIRVSVLPERYSLDANVVMYESPVITPYANWSSTAYFDKKSDWMSIFPFGTSASPGNSHPDSAEDFIEKYPKFVVSGYGSVVEPNMGELVPNNGEFSFTFNLSSIVEKESKSVIYTKQIYPNSSWGLNITLCFYLKIHNGSLLIRNQLKGWVFHAGADSESLKAYFYYSSMDYFQN